MKTNKTTSGAALVFALVMSCMFMACTKDDAGVEQKPKSEPVRITARISADPATRIAYDESDNPVKLTWEVGDAFLVDKDWTDYIFTCESVSDDGQTGTFVCEEYEDGVESLNNVQAEYPADYHDKVNYIGKSLLGQVQAINKPKAHLGPLHRMDGNFDASGNVSFRPLANSILKFTFTGLEEGEELQTLELVTDDNFFNANIGVLAGYQDNISLGFEEGTTIDSSGELAAYIMVWPHANFATTSNTLTVTLTTNQYIRIYENDITMNRNTFYEATIGTWDTVTPITSPPPTSTLPTLPKEDLF